MGLRPVPAIENAAKFNRCAPARTADLKVTVKTPGGEVLDEHTFPGLNLAGGRSLLKLPAIRPKLSATGF